MPNKSFMSLEYKLVENKIVTEKAHGYHMCF